MYRLKTNRKAQKPDSQRHRHAAVYLILGKKQSQEEAAWTVQKGKRLQQQYKLKAPAYHKQYIFLTPLYKLLENDKDTPRPVT